jgi:hypothetical protein
VIHPAVESDRAAENAPRFQQPFGKPYGFPTDPTATTTTGYSWCPLKRGRSEDLIASMPHSPPSRSSPWDALDLPRRHESVFVGGSDG